MARFIDLNHVIEDGMPTYPGIPVPSIGPYLDHEASRERYEGRAEFHLGKVDMAGNVGTYLDSPFHRYPEGSDLSRLPLDALAEVPGLLLDRLSEGRVAIDAADLEPLRGAAQGQAVLIRTGWDARWGTDEYWLEGPYLTGDAADLLVEAGASIVGVDFSNIDDTRDPARPVHTRLLAAGIPIVEHLTSLEALPETGFRFSAVPPRIVRGAAFPVRAFAAIGDDG